MWGVLHMRVKSIVAVVAPSTGKIIKNGLQNGIFHFVLTLRQSPEIAL